MTSLHKLYLGLAAITVFVAGMITLYEGWPNLSGTGQLNSSNILMNSVGVAMVLVGIAYISGVKGAYQSGDSKGAQMIVKFSVGIALLFLIFGALVGWDKIPGYASDLRNETNAFLSRDASPPAPPPARLTSAQRVAAMSPQRTVELVLCTRDQSTGWSREVPVDPRLRFRFVQDVDGQYLSGRWRDIVDENIPDLVSKLRFCTQYAGHVGTDLYITWTEKTR